ncbi:MAG TPA: segregation/condensation protein A [Anaerolineae bacterium]|nr:segregation/condensation protein A [Anaerolineae bacterium]
MERSSAYQVRLDVFSGPLDLLLHLIEQEQLDITAISLAKVTDQYLAYLEVVQERRADDLVEFVAIAARLLLIKSRALLPQPPVEDEGEEEDVGEDLVRRLREYRRIKQVASALRERDEAGLHMYLRTVPTSRVLNLDPRLDLGDTSLGDMIEALRVLLQEETEAQDEFAVEPYEVTIGQRIDHIQRLLRQHDQLEFQDLLRESASRLELIITLLAVLELIRSGDISVTQQRLFGPISITALRHDGAPAAGHGA